MEVTNRAREAETTRNEVQLAKDRAQRLVDVIAGEKAVAEEKLEAARPALEEAEAALNTIKPAHIGKCYGKTILYLHMLLWRWWTTYLSCVMFRSLIRLFFKLSYGAETGTSSAIDYANYGLRADPVST